MQRQVGQFVSVQDVCPVPIMSRDPTTLPFAVGFLLCFALACGESASPHEHHSTGQTLKKKRSRGEQEMGLIWLEGVHLIFLI